MGNTCEQGILIRRQIVSSAQAANFPANERPILATCSADDGADSDWTRDVHGQEFCKISQPRDQVELNLFFLK